MGELMTVGGRKPLEDRRIFVLYPNPIAAVDIAQRLEEAGAEALPIFDLRQLSWGLSAKLPDGAIAALDEHVGWAATAVAVLHEFAVPQVLGATERRRLLLRAKMPNAVFMPAPLDPAIGLRSLVVLLESHWPRLLRHAAFARRRPSALPMGFSGDRSATSDRGRAFTGLI